MSKKKQLAELHATSKENGWYVTDSSTAIHAAKNLLTANNRIIELEKILAITDTNKFTAACNDYFIKYHTKG